PAAEDLPGDRSRSRLDGRAGPGRRRRTACLHLLQRLREGAEGQSAEVSGEAEEVINHVIYYSIRHRGLVILAGLALALWGVFAVFQTPIDAVPDLSENQSIVFTEWPGHSPREIEDQITYPLSRSLQSLD